MQERLKFGIVFLCNHFTHPPTQCSRHYGHEALKVPEWKVAMDVKIHALLDSSACEIVPHLTIFNIITEVPNMVVD